MSIKRLFTPVILIFLVSACTAEPETVIQTVVHEATVELEVTRLVEVTVEVPKEIEVTREVPLEVTRIVEIERVITATPEPTPEPTPKPTQEPTPKVAPASAAASSEPDPTPTPKDLKTSLVETMLVLRGLMQNFGGQIDSALRGDPFSCLDAVVTYDTIAAAPTFDVAGTDLDIQNAYGQYRASIDIFTNGTRDMVGNCRELITGEKESTSIPFQQWGLARQQVDNAIGTLSPAIVLLGGED